MTEDEKERKKRYKKLKVMIDPPIDTQSSATATYTTTSGAAISDVFGEDSPFMDIIGERDKKTKFCKVCIKWFSSWRRTCPVCGNKLD